MDFSPAQPGPLSTAGIAILGELRRTAAEAWRAKHTLLARVLPALQEAARGLRPLL